MSVGLDSRKAALDLYGKMEIVLCDEHRGRCLLKTGVRDGPNKGKSFYVCSGSQGNPCGFIQPTEIPPSHCLHHDEAAVELQAVVMSQEPHSYRLFFRCVVGRREGKKWCGSVPWKRVELKENLLDGESPPSRPPQERNPFKAPSKTGQPSDWRIIQEGGSSRAERGDKSRGGGEDGGSENRVRKTGARQTPPGLSSRAEAPHLLPWVPEGPHPHADPHALHSQLSAQLKQKKATLSVVNVSALPDKGERLQSQVRELEEALESLSLTPPGPHAPPCGSEPQGVGGAKQSPASSLSNPFSRPGGTILLPGPAPLPAPPASLSLQMSHYGGEAQALYGGRMTESRLLVVKNATAETIDHLHHSLESCPAPDTEAPEPKGIKVPLLLHQKHALAWLLWRETQRPCGGILADDMGLGKTLTVIALILAQRKKKAEEEEKKAEKEEGWISKTDSARVASQATLVICPASLVHHWKKEIERHVKKSRLTVYLYHGPSRQRSASLLAEHDVVVTTYSLVSKEIPVQKEGAEKPSQDTEAAPDLSPCFVSPGPGWFWTRPTTSRTPKCRRHRPCAG
ncbi:hypothetical protein COCON_G00056330 [Conger conger]|uniref:GRF-type domain-containing protein n=1 Tax=Conger conger TaxID=82655 RepID=A0A9Q1DWK4_CONCO|nr:hypothetical protein COCON_G00056330 [Conger conger]